MNYLLVAISSILFGGILIAVTIRYGIGLGTRIVYRAKEDLPIFGKVDEPTEQTHTGDYDEVEEE